MGMPLTEQMTCAWYQVMAGHKTLSITAQYSHLMPEHMADEAEKILHRPVRKNVLTFPVAVPTATQTATF